MQHDFFGLIVNANRCIHIMWLYGLSCVIIAGMCNRTLSEELRRCFVTRRRRRNPIIKRRFIVANNINNNRKPLGVANGCVANGLLFTPCAVAVPSSPASWPNSQFRREMTPPPIARDRRTTNATLTV